MTLENNSSGELTTKFSIFTKPTFTGKSIENDSLQPQIHQQGTIHAAIHRLLPIPLTSSAYESDIEAIKAIVKVRKLNINIRQLIRRNRLRTLLKSNCAL